MRQRKDAGINKSYFRFKYWMIKKYKLVKSQEFEMTNMKAILTSTITVKELLDRHPQALRLFTDLGLLCVGCPTEAFHTLTDVAREHHLDLNQLRRRICEVIRDDNVIIEPVISKNRDPV